MESLNRYASAGLALVLSLSMATPGGAMEIDVRTQVVCLHTGAVAVDIDGRVGPLSWPSDPASTAIFDPFRRITGDAQIGVSPDPKNPARWLGSCTVGSPNSSGAVRYRVADGVDDATDETPDSFWLEAEFEYTYEGSLSGTGDTLRFLDLSDDSSQRVFLRLRGGQELVWQLVNASGEILPAPKTLITGSVPRPGTRCALRLHWEAASGAGNDGTLRLVTVDLEGGTVLHDTLIEGCANTAFDGFAMLNAITGASVTAAEFLWDHITYSAAGPPGPMTGTAAWSEVYRLTAPAVGAQRTSSDGAHVELRVAAAWPDGEIGGRLSAATATIGFEYRRVGDQTWSGSGVQHDARTSMFGFASETVSDLDPLAAYEVRAVFERDGEAPRRSRAALVRTLSARDGAPGVISLGTYSCISPKASPTYAPSTLARRAPHEIQCLGDFAYTNVDMGYNSYSEYLAFGPPEARRLEWNRIFLLQLLSPTIAAGTYEASSHWVILDDHLFRDDLAGGLEIYDSGEGKQMLDELGSFVEDTVCRLFFPHDGSATVRQYWWTRETARTLSLFLECRQAADHLQTRLPKLPVDRDNAPWNGLVGEGDQPLLPGETSTWGTTVLGAEQTAFMIAAIESTTKPVVIIHSPVIVANGSQREYQDTGTYPEIWDILQACEANAAIEAVVIISGDLHLSMVIPGQNVPSPARMAALGKPLSYPKLLWEAMIGGGGQGGHRLRWQIGNEVDADDGLRGGAWDGQSAPRWEYAADYNSRWPGDEVVPPWDYDFYNAVTWDGDGATSGIGNTARQERVGVLTIDEASLSITLEVIDVQTEDNDYVRTDALGCECPADRDGNCRTDTRDVLLFLNQWASGDPDADFNDDGDINTLDVLTYFNAWVEGC